jgi:hypothetical protein
MKVYEVKLKENAKYRQIKTTILFERVEEWRKDYSSPGGVSKEEWEALSIDEAISKFPLNVSPYYGTSSMVVSLEELHKSFEVVDLIRVVDVDVENVFDIDIEALADKISSSIIGKTTENIYNQRLEIHQPNSPLFMYNEYKVLTDCCTEYLQEEIDNGWRVVSVCPQPDQRRPDYVVAKYNAEKEKK